MVGRKPRAARTLRRLTVRYGVDSVDKVGFTRNISATGAFLQTNVVMPPGTVLRLELAFPERTFALRGVVAWAKKVPPRLAHLLDCGMGVRFVQPPVEFREFFEQWQPSAG